MIMEPKKNNWQIALSNLGAVYFFACLGSNAPFVFTLIGFLLFVFVSMPVMMKKAFRKIPLEEINILTPEQEDKIYNSKQTIKMLISIILIMIITYYVRQKKYHLDDYQTIGVIYSGFIIFLISIYFGEYRIGYDFIKRQKFWNIMMIIDTFITTIVYMYVPWGSAKFFLLSGLVFYWAFCWDKQTVNRKKQMIIEQRQANISQEKTSIIDEKK